MKAFVVLCVVIACATGAPQYGGYGGNNGGSQTIQMQPAGSPAVNSVPNTNNYGGQTTYTAPGQTYQAQPVTYAAPMITFNPPNIAYNGQSVTYATQATSGNNGGSNGGSNGMGLGGGGGYGGNAAPAMVMGYGPSSSSSGGYQ